MKMITIAVLGMMLMMIVLSVAVVGESAKGYEVSLRSYDAHVGKGTIKITNLLDNVVEGIHVSVQGTTPELVTEALGPGGSVDVDISLDPGNYVIVLSGQVKKGEGPNYVASYEKLVEQHRVNFPVEASQQVTIKTDEQRAAVLAAQEEYEHLMEEEGLTVQLVDVEGELSQNNVVIAGVDPSRDLSRISPSDEFNFVGRDENRMTLLLITVVALIIFVVCSHFEHNHVSNGKRGGRQ